jgi:hypothetical protein
MNKANLYLITKEISKGKAVYKILANENVLAMNGISFFRTYWDKNKNALLIAAESLENSCTYRSNIKNQTQERYVQALIWNKIQRALLK